MMTELDMSKLKLTFFVNGSEVSSTSVRTKMLADRLPSNWEICLNYRPIQKWKGISSFIQSALSFRPDVVYVVDTAYTGVLAGCIVKKLIGCKLLTDTGDMAFELAKSKGIYSRMQLALIDWIEKMAIQNSDCIIVRGSYHKIWLETHGVSNIVFVPDGVNLDAVYPIDANTLKIELGLENHLVIGLIGTMSWSKKYHMCYGWEIIEALGFLKDTPIKALLVGDGEGRSQLEKRAQELGVSSHVVFTGRLPYDELLKYISAMDVCVSTQSNDLVGMVRTTGKLPLYLACGKYVVATNVGEASRVLIGLGGLLSYEGVRDDTYPERLAQHLRELLAHPERLDVAEEARQRAKNNFDYQMLARRVEKVCQELILEKLN